MINGWTTLLPKRWRHAPNPYVSRPHTPPTTEDLSRLPSSHRTTFHHDDRVEDDDDMPSQLKNRSLRYSTEVAPLLPFPGGVQSNSFFEHFRGDGCVVSAAALALAECVRNYANSLNRFASARDKRTQILCIVEARIGRRFLRLWYSKGKQCHHTTFYVDRDPAVKVAAAAAAVAWSTVASSA